MPSISAARTSTSTRCSSRTGVSFSQFRGIGVAYPLSYFPVSKSEQVGYGHIDLPSRVSDGRRVPAR